MLLMCMMAVMRAIVRNDCFCGSAPEHRSKEFVDLKKARASQTAMKKSTHRALIEAFTALNTLPVSAAILDSSGMIVAVNDTWSDFAQANELRIPDAGVGANYLNYCVDPQFTRELEALLAGRLDLVTLVYPCHSPREKRWFSLIGIPLSLGKPGGVALLHVNLTGVLPPQIDTSVMHAATAGRIQLSQKADVARISGAIEQSVSQTLSSQLNKMFAGRRDKSAHQAERLPIRLSERQIQVLRLLGEGKTNREIAEALFRSPNTIKLHVSAILKQLRLKSRTQAALLASQLSVEGAIHLPVGSFPSSKKTRAARAQRSARRGVH
jgi:DNA-binding CsgD family transcriptional regulator